MASLLENQIRKTVASAFKGKLLKGVLRRYTSDGMDANGDPLPGTKKDYPFEGIRDSFRAEYAVAAGIPTTDAKILIIGGSVAVVPQKDDWVQLRGQWNKVRKVVEIDPANATYTLAAFESGAPP